MHTITSVKTGEELNIKDVKNMALMVRKYEVNNQEFEFDPPVEINIAYHEDTGWYDLSNEEFELDESGKDLDESIAFMMFDIISMSDDFDEDVFFGRKSTMFS